MAAETTDGVYCRPCGRRHGYMSMDIHYEKQNQAWVMHWICRSTGDYIGELWIGGANARPE